MKNDDQAPDVGNKDGFNGGAIQHTPGPWVAHFEEDVMPGSAATEITHLEGACIARAYGAEDFPCLDEADEKDAELAANARLISAAPILLEALQKLVRLYIANPGDKHEFISCKTPKGAWEMTHEERAKSEVWAAFDAARRAITAATGS